MSENDNAGLTLPVFSTPGRSHQDTRLAYNMAGQLAANHIRSRVGGDEFVVRLYVAPEAGDRAIQVVRQFESSQELHKIVRERVEIPQGAPYQNPRYIRVVSLTGKGAGRYTILQLAEGNERASVPIYHAVRRDRAKGPYTSEEAVAAIQRLIERDQTSGAILRAQVTYAERVPDAENIINALYNEPERTK